MRYSTLFSAALSAVILPFFTLADHDGLAARRHNALAHRRRGDLQTRETHSGARATFYDVGLGACGKWNVASDFIVALNSAQFGGSYPSPWCFKSITIQHNGNTAVATIMDECPGCPYAGLDMSRGLFDHFASESVGVLSVTWWTNDGSGGGGGGGGAAPAPPPPPKPTSAWTPPASSQWTNPSPSKAANSPARSSAPASAYKTPTHSKAATSAASAAPSTPASVPASPQNLQGLSALIGSLGNFVAHYGL